MSRLFLKTATVFLLSVGAACAQAPAPHPQPAPPMQFNAAAYPFGATSIPKYFTGGRIAANGAPIAAPASTPHYQPNDPTGM